MAKIRVFVVDDHPVVCDGIRRMLETEPDIQVVGEAHSAEEAIGKIPSLDPHVVLMDVRLPGMDGIDAVRYLKRVESGLNIIVLTSYGDEYLAQAVEAGATGYLLKRAGRDELIRAIRATWEGECPIDPSLTHQLFTEFADLAKSKRRFSSVESPLSSRETQILQQIAQGKSNKEVAQSLNISERTVKNHITSILSKLNAHDRTQAVLAALRKNLISM